MLRKEGVQMELLERIITAEEIEEDKEPHRLTIAEQLGGGGQIC